PHLAALHASGEGDLDHAAAGAAGDFKVGQFFLGALHALLHLLGLLHQLGDVSTHRVHLGGMGIQLSSKGRMESGTTLAPGRDISRCTSGSARKVLSASRWRASRLRASRSCRVSPSGGAAAENRIVGAAPKCGASALASCLTRNGAFRWSSEGGSASSSTPFS